MARELSAILSELNNVYDPQRQVVKQQQDAIDPALQAEEQGLEYAKKDAFGQIQDQANRRGMFYSGMPVAEEQRYTGGTYLPALANLRGKYGQQRFNLQDTLNKIQQDQYNNAYGIREREVEADEKRRQFDEQMAATERANAASRAAAGSGMASPSFGLGGGAAPEAGGFGMQKRANGGFNFVGPGGQAVSAATYAASTGVPFRTLLQQMASQGDAGAKAALGFVGGDYGYDPGKISVGNNAKIYDSLVWGTGKKSPFSGVGVPNTGVR